jgi:predicted GIY-YIG superfamily endonuclease
MLRGRGCWKCGSESCANKKIIGRDAFIDRAGDVHGGVYSYERVVYERAHLPVEIYCTKCNNFFKQTPTHHMAGAGCPCCAPYGFQTGDIGSLYLINCESSFGSFTGYGISNNAEQRLRQHTLRLSKSAFVITQQHTWDFPIGSSALALENAMKKQFPQTSRLGCAIEGFKRESTDAPFEQVKEFIESILKENPEWQLT